MKTVTQFHLRKPSTTTNHFHHSLSLCSQEHDTTSSTPNKYVTTQKTACRELDQSDARALLLDSVLDIKHRNK